VWRVKKGNVITTEVADIPATTELAGGLKKIILVLLARGHIQTKHEVDLATMEWFKLGLTCCSFLSFTIALGRVAVSL